MWTMRLDNSLWTSAVSGTEHDRVCESPHARSDFDGTAASEIQNPPFIGPTGRIPNPASHGTIHECGPNESEDDGRKDPRSFGDCAQQDTDRDCGKLRLELCKEQG